MDELKYDVNARISVLENTVETHDKRIDTLESRNNEITKLSTLMEMTIETNKEQTKTLQGINDNLTKLNQGYDNLNLRLGTLETDISDSKDNNTIDLNKLRKDVIFKVIPSVIGGLLLAWLLITFGLK